MTIAVILQLLASLFGPMLVAAIKKWLESLLNRAAKSIQPNFEASVSPAVFSKSLFERAMELTPKTQVFKRALLRHMRDVAPACIEARAVDRATAAEIRAMGRAAAA